MMQIVEQTKEEKIAMYMKLSKRELAEMLFSANRIIDTMTPTIEVYPGNPAHPDEMPIIFPNHLYDPNNGPFYTTYTT